MPSREEELREIIDKVAEYGYLSVDKAGRDRCHEVMEEAISAITKLYGDGE